VTALAEIRALMPCRPLTATEARSIGERQAARLLRHYEITEPPVSELVIEHFPRVRVRYITSERLAGASRWSHGTWRILVNRGDYYGRRRFTLAHEFKHVLDHPFRDVIYNGRRIPPAIAAEYAADTFAAALLMPRAWVKRAFYDHGIRDERMLARRFGVSALAMRRRITELGLLEPDGVLA